MISRATVAGLVKAKSLIPRGEHRKNVVALKLFFCLLLRHFDCLACWVICFSSVEFVLLQRFSYLHSWSSNGCPLDTRKMVLAFERAKFTPEQARVITEMFRETLARREKQNYEQLASKGDYMQVKTELRILEKSDFHLLSSDLEHLETNIEKNIAGVHTELERSRFDGQSQTDHANGASGVLNESPIAFPIAVENRVIKYVLGSAFFLSVFGYSLWFFVNHADFQMLSITPEDGSDGFYRMPSPQAFETFEENE
mmetsp:Transcript_23837/g.93740  ORF Transcript_23837/g.93740 Transcript_23837/m.93740 type:complete len:255 (-) Transcript_23837:2052-2816(-)